MRQAFIVLFVAVAVGLPIYGVSHKSNDAPLEPLTIAVGAQPLSALLFIAEARGYFAEQGLRVDLRLFSHGKKAIQAVAAGQADLVTVAEMPFVTAARAGENMVAVATIESSDRQNLVVGRKDHGVTRPRDVIGKRIGIIPGTSSEVFLDAFLAAHAVSKTRLQVVPLAPEGIGPALEQGTIDAASLWALPGAVVIQRLASNAQVFREKGLYVHNWILVAKKNTAAEKQPQIRKVLRALMRAEEFESEQRPEAVSIVARKLNLNRDLVASAWPNYNFKVGLHQYLLINLETHARLSKNQQSEPEYNFAPLLMYEPLLAVDPSRVTLLH